MDVDDASDLSAASVAAAIGEPARARMLYSLMDGCARTSTELAAVADVAAPTASAHLARLRQANLVAVSAQGKHRYYRLADGRVAAVLEGLSVLAGGHVFVPTTPRRLRLARTCYDHLAGRLGVSLLDRLLTMGWLTGGDGDGPGIDVTSAGRAGLAALGIDVAAVRRQRRSLGRECLDWSERRPHLGGGLAAALLQTALDRRWLVQEPDSRALAVTAFGKAELTRWFGVGHEVLA